MRHNKQVTPKYQIDLIRRRHEKDVFKVTVGLVMSEGWFKRVKFVAFNNEQTVVADLAHTRNDDVYAYFEGEVGLEYSALYYYYFSYECNGQKCAYKDAANNNYRVNYKECFKMSVGFEVPNWAQDEVIYHIFLDRFRRGSSEELRVFGKRTINKWDDKPVLGPNAKGLWNGDFYGGDLKGVIDSLDYLKKLGVSILYISPICESETNHRYDTADYNKVDPYAGINEDLKLLCKEAHKRGQRIVLDAVFNHTGSDSKYFNKYGTYDTVGAYQSTESPYFHFYETHIDEYGKVQFKYWWDFDNLPVCRTGYEGWIGFICDVGGVIDKWFELGIDGLRLDVADELTDYMIYRIVEAVKRNKSDGAVWGEVWESPMRKYDSFGNKRRYISSGKGFHATMNYPFTDALLRYFKYADTWKLGTKIEEIFSEYPNGTIFAEMNFTSTHDISRWITMLGCNHEFVRNDRDWAWKVIRENDHEFLRNFTLTREEYLLGRARAMAYATVLAFFPGNMTIFYGDEVGATGLGNIMNRSSYPWKRRDKKLLKFLRNVIKAKRSKPEYKMSKCNILAVGNEHFVFERIISDKRLVVAISRVNYETNFVAPYKDYEKEVIFKHGTKTSLDKIDALGAIVYEVKY